MHPMQLQTRHVQRLSSDEMHECFSFYFICMQRSMQYRQRGIQKPGRKPHDTSGKKVNRSTWDCLHTGDASPLTTFKGSEHIKPEINLWFRSTANEVKHVWVSFPDRCVYYLHTCRSNMCAAATLRMPPIYLRGPGFSPLSPRL